VRVVPVLDLRGGAVVRGVAGPRAEYRPVVSRLTASADPRDVARAFRDHFGLDELYVADLDAIAGHPASLATFEDLRALGFRLWVDAGLRDAAGAGPLLAAGVATVVAGLETLAGPQALAGLVGLCGERLLFSLDLKGGLPLGLPGVWKGDSGWTVAGEAVRLGVRRVLVLDLARVGVGTGTGTEDLCRRLRSGFPSLEVVAGGGVRGPDDLARLRACGVDAVLVASALHDGQLKRQDVK
jgi:phosphoribosylformimino-5-aminoimidazole carboxamide ribotide isomerase